MTLGLNPLAHEMKVFHLLSGLASVVHIHHRERHLEESP